MQIEIMEWVGLGNDVVEKMEFPTINETLTLIWPDGNTLEVNPRMAQNTYHFLRWAKLFNYVPSTELFLKKGEWLTPSGCKDLVNKGLRETLIARPELLASDLGGIALDIANYTSELSLKRSSYMTTIDVEDYHQIENDPEIRKEKSAAISRIKETVNGAERYRNITRVHGVLESRVKEGFSSDLRYNMLAVLINAHILKLPQFKQAFLRGYCTDVNSEFGPEPILSGIYGGLRTVYDLYMESLSGVKSQRFTTEPVQATEYTNRQQQLIGGYFKNFHSGDCGSTITYKWPIDDAEELERFDGKNILLDDGHLHEINGKADTHLIGTIVNVRNIWGCKHPDPVGCCATCLGGITRSIPYNVMTGVGLITELFAVITQKVISVKHDDTSTVGKEIPLPARLTSIIKIDDDGRTVSVDHRKGRRGLKMFFSIEDVKNLAEIDMYDDLSEINPNRISDITNMVISWQDKDGFAQYETMRINNGKTHGKLTKEFLVFLKDNPTVRMESSISKTKMLEINLDDLPTDIKIVTIPFKHTSMLDLHRKIDLYFRSSATEDKEEGRSWKYNSKSDPFLSSQETFVGALHTFHDLLKDKFSINQMVLEGSLWPFTARDPENNDWYPVKNGGKCHFPQRETLVGARSGSVHTVYQKHHLLYQSPYNYTIKNKVPHTMDSTYV